MYSKPKPSQDTAFRIPENYSGNAFQGDSVSPSPPVVLPTEEPTVTDIAQTDPVPQEPLPAVALPEQEEELEPVMKKVSPFASLLPPRLIGSHGGLLGDIGVEELLIIGILILLSQSETDDDILLLLMLLLFYK